MGIRDRLTRYAEFGRMAAKVGVSVGDRLGQAREVANSLGKLRGAAMKFGQAIAVAAEHLDVPDEVRDALSALHARGEPVPFETIRAVVTRELGPLQERFASFDPHPLGTASLAQAHAAVLPDGTSVVVKVLHDGVEESVDTDLGAFQALLSAWRVSGRGQEEAARMVEEVRERLFDADESVSNSSFLQELSIKLSRIIIERLYFIIFIMRIYYLSFCKTRKRFKYFMLSNILRNNPGCTPRILEIEPTGDAVYINYFACEE